MLSSELAIALIRRIARDGDETVHVNEYAGGIYRNREIEGLQQVDGDLVVSTTPGGEQS